METSILPSLSNQLTEALPQDYIEIVFKKDSSNDDVRHLNINLIGNKYLNILD